MYFVIWSLVYYDFIIDGFLLLRKYVSSCLYLRLDIRRMISLELRYEKLRLSYFGREGRIWLWGYELGRVIRIMEIRSREYLGGC